MTSYTATALINDALVDLQVLAFGQTANSDLLAGGLRYLNQMLERWTLDRFMVPAVRVDLYNLTAATVYTIGPTGADLTAARPLGIEDANVLLTTVTPTYRKGLKVTYDADEFASIRTRDIFNVIPWMLYYDKNFDPVKGFGSINLYPGPTAGQQLELFTWQILQSFPDLTTSINLPPGYAECIRSNFAVTFAPAAKAYFKTEPMLDQVLRTAASSKSDLENYNAPEAFVATDPAFLSARRNSAYNFFTGGTGRNG